jgi:hypothetical protein
MSMYLIDYVKVCNLLNQTNFYENIFLTLVQPGGNTLNKPFWAVPCSRSR